MGQTEIFRVPDEGLFLIGSRRTSQRDEVTPSDLRREVAAALVEPLGEMARHGEDQRVVQQRQRLLRPPSHLLLRPR